MNSIVQRAFASSNKASFSTLLAVLLCCLALLVSSVAMAGKKPAKPTLPKVVPAATAATAWAGVHSQYHTNFWLAGQLLSEQAKLKFNVPASQLKIQWNAGSIMRLTKAYDFYLKGLSDHFPSQETAWKSMRAWNKKLGIVASLIRKDALTGAKGNFVVWGSVLKTLEKGYQSKPSKAPKQATVPKHFKYLLETISGIGTGAEILSYYRLQQIRTGLLAKKVVGKAALGPLGALLGHFRASKGLFLTLRKQLPGSKWLGLYAYHASLLYRCGLLFGKSLRSNNSKKKVLQARYKKRSLQLQKSLKKANSSFKKFWRL